MMMVVFIMSITSITKKAEVEKEGECTRSIGMGIGKVTGKYLLRGLTLYGLL